MQSQSGPIPAGGQGKPISASRPAFLYNKLTNERYPLTQSVSKIGRDQTNNISITNDHYISRHHSWVLQMQGGYWIEDLGSTNGTLVNGELLGERRQINPGDRLTIGKTELIFVME
jgi:pSer/pThr/pTyr-binding forkhead associated (FHA) protein